MAHHTKQVNPRRVPSLFNAMSRRVAIPPARAVDMALKPYIALDRLVARVGGRDEFDALTQYSIFVEALCSMGLLAEDVAYARDAQGALLQCAKRQRRSGQWALEEEAYDEIKRCLDLFWRQLQAVSAPQLVAALDELRRLMELHSRAFLPQDLAA